jgi:hypothetical protein
MVGDAAIEAVRQRDQEDRTLDGNEPFEEDRRSSRQDDREPSATEEVGVGKTDHEERSRGEEKDRGPEFER